MPPTPQRPCVFKSHPGDATATSILVLRWGGVGDFLLTLPAIYSLRRSFRNAHIAIMGSADTIALAESADYAEEFLLFDWQIASEHLETRQAAQLAMLRTLKRFDFIVSFHSFGPLGELLDKSGVNYASFDEEVFRKERKHASGHFCDFVRSLPTPPVFSRPKVYLDADERRFALSYLSDCGLNWKSDCIIAIHAGSGDPQKRWFADRFRDVVRFLADGGSKVLLLSGPSDAAITNHLHKEAARDNVFIVSGIAIRKVAAIIERSTLFFGNDSGLMHLAAAVDTPVVALFGPSDAVVWGPTGNLSVVLTGNCSKLDRTPAPCDSCTFQECLDSIKTGEVIRVISVRLNYLRNCRPGGCPGRHFY